VNKPPIGINNTTNNIDTVAYNNYGKKGGRLQKKYGLAKLISEYNQRIYLLQNKLNSLSYQISGKVDKLNDFTRNIAYSGKEGFEGYKKEDIPKEFLKPVLITEKIKRNIVRERENTQQLDNILRDTDIKILQQNYRYMMWTILALAAVLVTMKVKNNT
jgi:hypothetical protein